MIGLDLEEVIQRLRDELNIPERDQDQDQRHLSKSSSDGTTTEASKRRSDRKRKEMHDPYFIYY